MARRNYLNFTTPYGVELTSVAKSGLSAFIIHECGHLPSLVGWNHERVDSPFWRFYHNRTPGAAIRHEGNVIALDADTVVVIPAYTVFDCLASEAVSHFWIHFTLARHSRVLLDKPELIRVTGSLGPALDEAIAIHNAAPSELRSQQLFHAAASLLHLGFSKIASPLAPAASEQLSDVLAVIHQAPHSDLSNDFLARRSGMSVEKFIRWFRKQMGETPAAYVSRARVKMASESLALTDKSIDHIAAEAGFPNRFYFSRVFARDFGCGPSEFRRRQREKRGL